MNGCVKDDIILSKFFLFENRRKDAGVSVRWNQITFSKYLQHVNNYLIQNNILILQVIMTVCQNNSLVSGILSS